MAIRHKIILINGAPGVGKSWLAKALYNATTGFQSPYIRVAKRIKFADGIYRVAQEMFNLSYQTDEEWAEWKETKIAANYTGRDFLIRIGRLGRSFNVDFWVQRCIDEIKKRDASNLEGYLWVIDDLGFENEVLKIQAHPDFDCLTVYIDDKYEESVSYMTIDGPLRQFENDSRYDLSRYCTIRAHDSNDALDRVLTALKNRNW